MLTLLSSCTSSYSPSLTSSAVCPMPMTTVSEYIVDDIAERHPQFFIDWVNQQADLGEVHGQTR